MVWVRCEAIWEDLATVMCSTVNVRMFDMCDGVMENDSVSERSLLPKVVIVVINYNYAQFVSSAIESALAQTYANTEIHVIDDGSSDASEEIILRYQDEIIFHRQSNQGIVNNRNDAIKLASKADFLIQLDADDYLDERYVEIMVECANRTGADIVYCQAHYIGRVEFNSIYPEYSLEKLKHENYIMASSLFRVKSILEKKVTYDKYLDKLGYEDWDFALNLCLHNCLAVRVDKPLYFYRKHADMTSRNDAQEQDIMRQLLVRHHLLQKFNADFPDEFNYFSSEIDLLFALIQTLKQNSESIEKASRDLKYLNERLARIENSILFKIASKMLVPIRYIHNYLIRK